MIAVAELAPWLIIVLVIVICELGKALRSARSSLREALKQLAEADRANVRIRADRDHADASLRRINDAIAAMDRGKRNAPQQLDQTGQPFTLDAWKPESKPS